MKNKLAIFASGSGTNADAIVRYFKDRRSAEVALIITNKADAGVIKVAQQHQVPHLVIRKEQLTDPVYLLGELKKYAIDWIILAGFLVMVPPFLVKEFKNKIINIHPALLPRFGGKGMYGRYVHEAVLKAGEMRSGITIHYVTEEYDEGKIIFQTEIPVLPNESVLSLEEKIHQLEHRHYPIEIEKLVRHES